MNLTEAFEKIGEEFSCASDLAYDHAFLSKRAIAGDRVILLAKNWMTRAWIARIDSGNAQDLLDHASMASYYRREIEVEGFTPFFVQFHGLTADFDQAEVRRMTSAEAIAEINSHMAALPPIPEVKRDRSCLDILCPEYYEAARQEVSDRGLLGKLDAAIERLCVNYASHRYWYRCRLTKDYAPMSFGWVPQTKNAEREEWRNMVVGGLIFHESSQDWQAHS